MDKENQIIYSIYSMSRGRQQGLKRLINSVFENAKNPKCVEIVVYIDDDDWATRKLYEGEYKDNPNIVFIMGTRVGYLGWRLVWDKFYEYLRGDVFMAIPDDCWVILKHFDEVYYKFKDQAVVFGPNRGRYRCRFGYTRKLVEQDEYIRNYANPNPIQKADRYIADYAISNGFYVKTSNMYRKSDGRDKTYKERFIVVVPKPEDIHLAKL